MAYRILIVDDQREVSRLLRSALETIEQGLDVSEAPSGEEALLEAGRAPVDLLVVDYRLPGMSGVELMKKIRARNPNIKIIIISGVSDPKSRAEIEKAGAEAYFIKPVPMADFLDTVERLLGMDRTILQTSAVSQPKDDQQERKTLSDLLVGLRKTLAAKSVFLLNSLGHVQAEAGELPNPNNRVSLIASLMGMHNAAQKVASLLGKNELHLHLFDSETDDLVFIPIGQTHVLWVIGKGLANLNSISSTLDILNATKVEMLSVFEQIGVEVSEPEEEPVPQGIPAFMESATIPVEFDELLRKASDKKEDANAFWDQAVEKGTQYAEPDKLTYEQAAQLGLAPKDEKTEESK